MKRIFNLTILPWLVLGCGGIGLAFRGLMYATAVDDKGLLISGNLPNILTWVLTALVAAGLLVILWKPTGSNRYADNFHASIPSAAGSFLAAAGILVTLLAGMGPIMDGLTKLCLITGFLSVPCLIIAALCRLKDKQPLFLFHAVFCVFLALHLANQYRIWSGEPQLSDYGFQLFASICLMLTAYHRCTFDAGLGQRRSLLFCGLMAVYLCCLAMIKADTPLLYLTGGIWAFTNLCTPEPSPRRPREIKSTDAPPEEAV